VHQTRGAHVLSPSGFEIPCRNITRPAHGVRTCAHTHGGCVMRPLPWLPSGEHSGGFKSTHISHFPILFLRGVSSRVLRLAARFVSRSAVETYSKDPPQRQSGRYATTSLYGTTLLFSQPMKSRNHNAGSD